MVGKSLQEQNTFSPMPSLRKYHCAILDTIEEQQPALKSHIEIARRILVNPKISNLEDIERIALNAGSEIQRSYQAMRMVKNIAKTINKFDTSKLSPSEMWDPSTI